MNEDRDTEGSEPYRFDEGLFLEDGFNGTINEGLH